MGGWLERVVNELTVSPSLDLLSGPCPENLAARSKSLGTRVRNGPALAGSLSYFSCFTPAAGLPEGRLVLPTCAGKRYLILHGLNVAELSKELGLLCNLFSLPLA